MRVLYRPSKLLSTPILLSLGLALTWVVPVSAFPHVVREGDTLAGLAERYYGRLQFERLLVAANGLEHRSARAIAPGMMLEIPALTHHRVVPGDTWQTIAAEHLGADFRADVLALANDAKPWIQPAVGTMIRIPYNLALTATGEESLATLAYRYLGSTKQAWTISHYNRLDEDKLERGDIFLIPVTNLSLTPEGQAAARRAASYIENEAAESDRERQVRIEVEIPALVADVRGGRYVQAIARGSRLLAEADPSQRQLARIHRQLLEAFVATDAIGQAVESCANWLKAEPEAKLDPIYLSPKILSACERVPEPPPAEPEPGPEGSSSAVPGSAPSSSASGPAPTSPTP